MTGNCLCIAVATYFGGVAWHYNTSQATYPQSNGSKSDCGHIFENLCLWKNGLITREILRSEMTNNRPSVSTDTGSQIYMGSEIRESITLLDVLYANEFEGEILTPEVVEQTEVNFYRGAPPQWLNFHIAEQTETPLIKRDGYKELERQIQSKRKGCRTSTVTLLHQPGSGGTTLAMQVLWDLRKTFRSAVLTGPTSDLTAIAKQVIHLFTAGSNGCQNTVLLLLSDNKILDSLQDSILAEIAEQNINAYKNVAILLNCKRKAESGLTLESQPLSTHIILRKTLSVTETPKFEDKKKELISRYGDTQKQFHGFNIMQTNFSQAYVQEACTVVEQIQKRGKPRRSQLVQFLSLLNTYVPGSYLLESQCQEILGPRDAIHGHPSFEERMGCFSHLIVTSTPHGKEKNVRLAHPMIAQQCTDMMAKAGVTRSETARQFLNCLCNNEVPPVLVGFVKDMLTKRGKRIKEGQEKFSRLILDIQEVESDVESASVLKVASKTFAQNPFFPQALARFYSIELQYYGHAEVWAKRAKERDPQNSFIADTLGQVHKYHLKNVCWRTTPRNILQLATKAIEAFKDVEILAENEQGRDMQGDGMTKVSHTFNNRGLFGYMKVACVVFNSLVKHNPDWQKVLRKEMSMDSLLKYKKLSKFNALITSLRDQVETNYDFFYGYLTYSKPSIKKDDPSYIGTDVLECYKEYVGTSPPNNLKQNIDIVIQMPKEYMAIFSKLLACPRDHPPELHMRDLLLFWIDKEQQRFTDLNEFIQVMHSAYENAFGKYFRSRYLRPLYFLGKDLGTIVLCSTLESLYVKKRSTKNLIKRRWSDDLIFELPSVQDCLLKVDGEVRNYRVYTSFEGREIEVGVHLRNTIWKPGQVSFYLGFNIRGLQAFGIEYLKKTLIETH